MKYKNLGAKVMFGLGLAQIACVGGIGVYITTDPLAVELNKKFKEQVKLERILDRGISITKCMDLPPEKMEQYIKTKEEYGELLKGFELAKSEYGKSKRKGLAVMGFGLTYSSLVTMLLSGVRLCDSDPTSKKEK